MHIFLTGEIQVGKSTAIKKVINKLEVMPGGFLTYFGPGRTSGERTLYMCGAWETKRVDQEYAVAVFHDHSPVADTGKFDAYGTKLLRESRLWATLILMDECGRLEAHAEEFQKEVLDCLEGSVPILGVIKKNKPPVWTDRIRQHPSVMIFEVDHNNRDMLPEKILDYLYK